MKSLLAELNMRYFNSANRYKQYITSEECDLSYKGNVGNKVVIPARSLVTLVSEMK